MDNYLRKAAIGACISRQATGEWPAGSTAFWGEQACSKADGCLHKNESVSLAANTLFFHASSVAITKLRMVAACFNIDTTAAANLTGLARASVILAQLAVLDNIVPLLATLSMVMNLVVAFTEMEFQPEQFYGTLVPSVCVSRAEQAHLKVCVQAAQRADSPLASDLQWAAVWSNVNSCYADVHL